MNSSLYLLWLAETSQFQMSAGSKAAVPLPANSNCRAAGNTSCFLPLYSRQCSNSKGARNTTQGSSIRNKLRLPLTAVSSDQDSASTLQLILTAVYCDVWIQSYLWLCFKTRLHNFFVWIITNSWFNKQYRYIHSHKIQREQWQSLSSKFCSKAMEVDKKFTKTHWFNVSV